MKLTTLIKDYLRTESRIKFPGLKVVRNEQLVNGVLYDFDFDGFRFGCVLQDLQVPKLTFFFYDGFMDFEESFWRCTYQFKLFTSIDSKDYKFTLSILGVRDLLSNFPVKVVMSRSIDSFSKFYHDLKSIEKMKNYRKHLEEEKIVEASD